MSSSRRKPWSPPSTPYRAVTSRMRPEHYEAMRLGADAELRGDAAEAFRQHRSVPMFAESLHGDRLQVLAHLGDEAPDWLLSRWLTVQARRPAWTAAGAVRRGRHGADPVETVTTALYPEGLPIEAVGCTWPEQVVPQLNGRDWAVRQTGLYENVELRAVLDAASPGLLHRAGRVREWCDAPMGGYRLEDLTPSGHLRVVDLATGEPIDLLDLGLIEHLEAGQHVIGRVVPTDTDPGRVWEWQPLPVDPTTAVAVAASPVRWLQVLRMKLAAGRLPVAVTLLPDASLTADLPMHSWMSLVGEVPGNDPSQLYPDLGSEALGVVLELADDDDPSRLAGCRHRVSELLLDADLTERARLPHVHPDAVTGWRRVAAAVPDLARDRALLMALYSDMADVTLDEWDHHEDEWRDWPDQDVDQDDDPDDGPAWV